MLSEGDKAECKEIAREIIKEVLQNHIASCPHGLLLAKNKALLFGLAVGLGLGSGVGGSFIVQVLTRMAGY